MTGYFRSLARRASGQGGWIRPALAPIVVPEAAPLVETVEETIQPAEPVDGGRPSAIGMHRSRIDANDAASPAVDAGPPGPESRADPATELARPLHVRRAEPAGFEPTVVEPGAPELPPPTPARRSGAPTAEVRRALGTPEARPGARPTQERTGESAPESTQAAHRGMELVAPASGVPRRLFADPSTERQRARPPRIAPPAAPAPPAVIARPARPAPRPPRDRSAEPIGVPSPRSSGQVVNVTIGRVEVRAPAPPPPPAPRPAPRPVPMMSLADYLRERGDRR